MGAFFTDVLEAITVGTTQAQLGERLGIDGRLMATDTLAPQDHREDRGKGIDNIEIHLQSSQMTGLMEMKMHTWPVQDAKARFSEFLDACLTEGPQMVTRRGAEAAVLVPVQAWRRLQLAAKPTLKQLLLSDEARAELLLPVRGQPKRRKVRALD